jgi:N-acetylneuraminic acid mutarotase
MEPPPNRDDGNCTIRARAVVCKDKLYVVDRRDAEQTTSDSVVVFDFATETWNILPAPMPQARTGINNAVVQHNGKVYVVGGEGGDSSSAHFLHTSHFSSFLKT